jgi:hypothetical protein
MLEEEFGLCFSFKPDQFDRMLETIGEALEIVEFQKRMSSGLLRLRKEKLDTSRLMIYCILEWKLDFLKMKDYSSEEWLSLCLNFEPCQEISQ